MASSTRGGGDGGGSGGGDGGGGTGGGDGEADGGGDGEADGGDKLMQSSSVFCAPAAVHWKGQSALYQPWSV